MLKKFNRFVIQKAKAVDIIDLFNSRSYGFSKDDVQKWKKRSPLTYATSDGKGIAGITVNKNAREYIMIK